MLLILNIFLFFFCGLIAIFSNHNGSQDYQNKTDRDIGVFRMYNGLIKIITENRGYNCNQNIVYISILVFCRCFHSSIFYCYLLRKYDNLKNVTEKFQKNIFLKKTISITRIPYPKLLRNHTTADQLLINIP